jgi:hypothetical protein
VPGAPAVLADEQTPGDGVVGDDADAVLLAERKHLRSYSATAETTSSNGHSTSGNCSTGLLVFRLRLHLPGTGRATEAGQVGTYAEGQDAEAGGGCDGAGHSLSLLHPQATRGAFLGAPRLLCPVPLSISANCPLVCVDGAKGQRAAVHRLGGDPACRGCVRRRMRHDPHHR